MNLQNEIRTASPDKGSPEVILFGSGACAHRIAANLEASGVRVCVVSGIYDRKAMPDAAPANAPLAMELIRCRGFAGKFELLLKNGPRSLTLNVPAVVVAENAVATPNYEAYGLATDSRVTDISALEGMLRLPEAKQPFDPKTRIAFFNGCQKDSQPEVAKRMLDACCQLQQRSGIHTYYFTGNLKVSADGAEMQVQQAKASGTVFLKFNGEVPTIERLEEGRWAIACTDELVRRPFRMHVDWIVVDETIGPASRLAQLARRLGIHSDAGGFAQADNVRRMNHATNRRGIFVAGGARDVLSGAAQRADADQVTLQVLAFLKELETASVPRVTIQRGRCARCLTCHRLCPHVAIDVGARITVVAEACQQCGICMAGCPARAIEMQDVRLGPEIDRRLQPPATQPDAAVGAGRILVFGCARSAGQAMALIRMAGQQLPQEVAFIEVPCGGTVAERHLLDAFACGAAGVMLCVCHTDNCQSEIGNRLARKRVQAVSELMAAAGVDDGRLRVATVAANMGTELAASVGAFAEEVAALGNP